MKIRNLNPSSAIYTSNVYLVTGTWNAIPDVNTLIDVGRDRLIIDQINQAATGVGKKKVEQVVLTHSHYDHASLLPKIREIFHPEVYAYSKSLPGVDHLLRDGEELKIGDRIFEVIYMPGHSNDSICLYCKAERVLFVGDVPIFIIAPGGTYAPLFVTGLERLARKDIAKIYFGHGSSVEENGTQVIRNSLQNVYQSLETNEFTTKANESTT